MIDPKAHELKPCPFCNGHAEIHEGVIYGYYVECSSCDASIGFDVGACSEVNGNFDGYGDALRAWNTRAPSSFELDRQCRREIEGRQDG